MGLYARVWLAEELKDVCISCLGLYLPKEVLPHMHKQGRVMISLNYLHYLVTSSNQIMEGESLGDYITCGTCDVHSGRHTEEIVAVCLHCFPLAKLFVLPTVS